MKIIILSLSLIYSYVAVRRYRSVRYVAVRRYRSVRYVAVRRYCSVPCLIVICPYLLFSNYSTYVFQYSLCLCFVFFVSYFVLFRVFTLFCVLFLLLYCLFPIFLQVYRQLPTGGNPTAGNKYRIVSNHIISSCLGHFTHCGKGSQHRYHNRLISLYSAVL